MYSCDGLSDIIKHFNSFFSEWFTHAFPLIRDTNVRQTIGVSCRCKCFLCSSLMILSYDSFFLFGAVAQWNKSSWYSLSHDRLLIHSQYMRMTGGVWNFSLSFCVRTWLGARQILFFNFVEYTRPQRSISGWLDLMGKWCLLNVDTQTRSLRTFAAHLLSSRRKS